MAAYFVARHSLSPPTVCMSTFAAHNYCRRRQDMPTFTAHNVVGSRRGKKQKQKHKDDDNDNFTRLIKFLLCNSFIFNLEIKLKKTGKIQRDGRKFLERFKKLFLVTSFITIIKCGPYLPITAKIRNKRLFFPPIYFLSLIVSRRRMLPPAFDV